MTLPFNSRILSCDSIMIPLDVMHIVFSLRSVSARERRGMRPNLCLYVVRSLLILLDVLQILSEWPGYTVSGFTMLTNPYVPR